MFLKLYNTRTIANAAIELSPDITLIAGDNRAGKSTIAKILGGLLSGAVMPFGEKNASAETEAVVGPHDQEGLAWAEFESDQTAIHCQWERRTTPKRPTIRVLAKGEGRPPPNLSPLVAGFERWSGLPFDRRSEILCAVYKAEPEQSDVTAFMKGRGIENDEFASRIWSDVKMRGWDITKAFYEQATLDEKRKWRAITKENWGSKKADDWKPGGWTDDLETADDQQLIDTVKALQEKFEGATVQRAVGVAISEEKIRHAKEAIKETSGINEALTSLELGVNVAGRNADDFRLKMLAQKTSSAVPCPCCGEDLIIKDGEILKAEDSNEETVTDEELRKAQSLHSGLNQKLRDAEARLSEALHQKERRTKAREFLANAKEQAEQDDEPRGPSASAISIDLEKVQARLTMLRQKAQADKIHKKQHAFSAAAECCSENGVRFEKLKIALKQVSRDLALRANAIGHGEFEINESLDVLVDGKAAICESEEWLVDVIMQCLIASAEAAQMIVIDSADTLTSARRGRLLTKVLRGVGIPVVVFTAAQKPEQVPDLSAKRLGLTYWIEDGEVLPISKKLTAKAA